MTECKWIEHIQRAIHGIKGRSFQLILCCLVQDIYLSKPHLCLSSILSLKWFEVQWLPSVQLCHTWIRHCWKFPHRTIMPNIDIGVCHILGHHLFLNVRGSPGFGDLWIGMTRSESKWGGSNRLIKMGIGILWKMWLKYYHFKFHLSGLYELGLLPLGTKMSHLGKKKIIFKRALGGDMLVARRVLISFAKKGDDNNKQNLLKLMALQLAKRHFQCQLKNHWTPSGWSNCMLSVSPQKTLGEKNMRIQNDFGSKHMKLHKMLVCKPKKSTS